MCSGKLDSPRRERGVFSLIACRKPSTIFASFEFAYGMAALLERLVTVCDAALANYARLKRLVARWIDRATDLSDLELDLRPPGRKASKRA